MRRVDDRPVYTAPTEASAKERFAETWGARYPAIIRLWENPWAEFVPLLNFDPEIRRVVCSTNAIRSINARIRRAVRARGHFPNEAAALKCVYLALMSLDPTGKGRRRWVTRWKPALNAFGITPCCASLSRSWKLATNRGARRSSLTRGRPRPTTKGPARA